MFFQYTRKHPQAIFPRHPYLTIFFRIYRLHNQVDTRHDRHTLARRGAFLHGPHIRSGKHFAPAYPIPTTLTPSMVCPWITSTMALVALKSHVKRQSSEIRLLSKFLARPLPSTTLICLGLSGLPLFSAAAMFLRYLPAHTHRSQLNLHVGSIGLFVFRGQTQ